MSRARRPFCQDCGGSDCHVVGNDTGGHLWLCGSCEMLRASPDAEKRKHPPGLPGSWPSRAKVKQKESLFDDRGD